MKMFQFLVSLMLALTAVNALAFGGDGMSGGPPQRLYLAVDNLKLSTNSINEDRDLVVTARVSGGVGLNTLDCGGFLVGQDDLTLDFDTCEAHQTSLISYDLRLTKHFSNLFFPQTLQLRNLYFGQSGLYNERIESRPIEGYDIRIFASKVPIAFEYSGSHFETVTNGVSVRLEEKFSYVLNLSSSAKLTKTTIKDLSYLLSVSLQNPSGENKAPLGWAVAPIRVLAVEQKLNVDQLEIRFDLIISDRVSQDPDQFAVRPLEAVLTNEAGQRQTFRVHDELPVKK
jgi:hypothetical protein